jgi:hypothetical protein
MSKENHEHIRRVLREAIPPVADGELKHDLWPQMLRRLDERPAQIPWFDWALLGLLGLWFLLFPKAIPFLLYQL